MPTIQFKGKPYFLNAPATSAGYGIEKKGDAEALILVMRKRGESPSAALRRVGVRHPGVNFNAFDMDALMDASSDFGVPQGQPDEWRFDIVPDSEELVFNPKHSRAVDALTSSAFSEQEAYDRILQELRDVFEDDKLKLPPLNQPDITSEPEA